MTPRRARLALMLTALAGAALAVALTLYALRSNLVFFYSPSQVRAGEAPAGRAFRVGGMVQPGSLQRSGMDVRFTVTDLTHALVVHYRGGLPDLFREGQGVVAQGRLDAHGVLAATEILAKHDEDYRAPTHDARADAGHREAAHRGATLGEQASAQWP